MKNVSRVAKCEIRPLTRVNSQSSFWIFLILILIGHFVSFSDQALLVGTRSNMAAVSHRKENVTLPPYPMREPGSRWLIAGMEWASYWHHDYPERTAWENTIWEDTMAATATQITSEIAHSGTKSLKVTMNLDAENEQDGLKQGEVWVDLIYKPPFECIPDTCIQGPENLDGTTISVYIYIPGDFPLNNQTPAGLQLFVKSPDASGNFSVSQYGKWNNIIERETWILLEHTPSDDPDNPDFDPTKIGLIGVKLALNGSDHSTQWSGSIYIDSVSWNDDGCPLKFGFETEESSIDQLMKTGANSVAIVDTWYQNSETSTNIYSDPERSHTDSELLATINIFKSKGLTVMMKPHVDIINSSIPRSEIRPAETDLDAWFESYEQYLIRCAQIAQSGDADMLCLECELTSMTEPDMYTRWEEVYHSVRAEFDGYITCAIDWGDKTPPEQHPMATLCDPIGMDIYMPLSDEQSPTLQQLLDGWQHYNGYHGEHYWLDYLRDWQQQCGKAIIFTEIGYASCDYSAKNPWWSHNPANPQSIPEPPNAELQARCLDAFQQTFINEGWFAGFYWWQWNPWPDAGGLCDTNFTLQNKPGADILYRTVSRPPADSSCFMVH